MRGFGVNQSAFAVENLLNRLARKVGIDAWEIRWRNALQQGDRFCTGQKLDKPFGFKQTLEVRARRFPRGEIRGDRLRRQERRSGQRGHRITARPC